MKIGKWAVLLLAATSLLAGCSGFWQAPSTGGGGTTPTTLSSGNFYTLNKGATTSAIYGFSIVSGVLTPLSGSPYPVTGQAFAMAMDSTGSYLYVSSTGGIYLYTISSSTGALTQSSLISSDITGTALAVGAAGNWLLEASDEGAINAIPLTASGTVDTTSGRNLQTVALAGTQVQQMALSTNTPLAVLSVALGSAGTQIFPFTSSATSNPIGTTPSTIKVTTASAGASVAVAMDPQNRLMYVGETSAFPSSSSSSGGLRAFSITTTSNAVTLTELAGSPYVSGGTGPHAITPITSGDFVYVGSWQGTSAGLVTPFQVTTSGSTFSLTAQTSTTATGDEPFAMDEDNLSHFILAVNYLGSPTLNAYIFDTTTTYKLDSAITDSTASSPIAILAAP